jgi:lipopolysaccharide transport system ATP-binding protein
VQLDGNPTRVANEFVQKNNEIIKSRVSKKTITNVHSNIISNLKASLLNKEGQEVDRVSCLDSCCFQVSFNTTLQLNRTSFYFGIHSTDFVYLTANNTAFTPIDLTPGTHKIQLNVGRLTLLPGAYGFLIWIGNSEGIAYFHEEGFYTFSVYSDSYHITRQGERGLLYLDANWKVDERILDEK